MLFNTESNIIKDEFNVMTLNSSDKKLGITRVNIIHESHQYLINMLSLEWTKIILDYYGLEGRVTGINT